MQGHENFPKNLRERRFLLFRFYFVLLDKLNDLENKSSPVVVKVRSSCIHVFEIAKGNITAINIYRASNPDVRIHFYEPQTQNPRNSQGLQSANDRLSHV